MFYPNCISRCWEWSTKFVGNGGRTRGYVESSLHKTSDNILCFQSLSQHMIVSHPAPKDVLPAGDQVDFMSFQGSRIY